MNQNFDLAYTAIKNKDFEYFLLTYESKNEKDEKDLLVLTTKWRLNIKKNIPETGALIFINNGNLISLLRQEDSISFLEKLKKGLLSEKKFKTSVTKISKEELIKFTIQ